LRKHYSISISIAIKKVFFWSSQKPRKETSPVKKEETKDKTPEVVAAKPAAKDARDTKKPLCPYGSKCYR